MDGGRKILHIDMDCFYAAIEIREHPELAGLPVAVGGSSGRGVLTTCNYEARKYGCRSAMPTFKALRLCPKLILLPVRFDLYRQESARVREIFLRYTQCIEPVSLDEAYLDISSLQSEASAVAWLIREQIRTETGLTASAGIAPNKFLAKIASDWNKPDGQFEIRSGEEVDFLTELEVKKINGVGKRTAERLREVGIRTCGDLRKWSEIDLARCFGKFGLELYQLCRGIDLSPVQPNRERKSFSSERTFRTDLVTLEEGLDELDDIVIELAEDLAASRHCDREISACSVKIKFDDFRSTTAQRSGSQIDPEMMRELLAEAWIRGEGRSVRLLGASVHFRTKRGVPEQLEMF